MPPRVVACRLHAHDQTQRGERCRSLTRDAVSAPDSIGIPLPTDTGTRDLLASPRRRQTPHSAGATAVKNRLRQPQGRTDAPHAPKWVQPRPLQGDAAHRAPTFIRTSSVPVRSRPSSASAATPDNPMRTLSPYNLTCSSHVARAMNMATATRPVNGPPHGAESASGSAR